MPQYFSPVPAFPSPFFFFPFPLRPSKDIISKCVFPSSPSQPTDGAHLLHPKTNLPKKRRAKKIILCGKTKVDDIRGERWRFLWEISHRKRQKFHGRKQQLLLFLLFSYFFLFFLAFFLCRVEKKERVLKRAFIFSLGFGKGKGGRRREKSGRNSGMDCKGISRRDRAKEEKLFFFFFEFSSFFSYF